MHLEEGMAKEVLCVVEVVNVDYLADDDEEGGSHYRLRVSPKGSDYCVTEWVDRVTVEEFLLTKAERQMALKERIKELQAKLKELED